MFNFDRANFGFEHEGKDIERDLLGETRRIFEERDEREFEERIRQFREESPIKFEDRVLQVKQR